MKKLLLNISFVALFAPNQLKAAEAQYIDTKLNQYSYKEYNKLPEVIDAHENLSSRSEGFKQFLEELEEFSRTSEIEVGARLVHKHHVLKQDEVVVEEYGEHNQRPALFSQPTNNLSGAVPASWFMSEGKYWVFEYTSDSAVHGAHELLREDTSHIEDVGRLIQKYKLDNYLAPSIMGRKAWSHFDPNKPMLEVSFDDTRLSIVSNAESSSKSDIPTSWAFHVKNFPIQHGCATLCAWGGIPGGPKGHYKTHRKGECTLF